jgi:hypothetical protein
MTRATLNVSIGLAALIMFCAAPGDSRAGLISLNDPSLPASADGFNITLDTSTGLEWLDVAVSADYTFQTIQSQFGPGGLFHGFRYATDLELTGNTPQGQVDSLFKSAGIGPAIVFSQANYALVRGLMGFVGSSGNTAQFGYAYGSVVSAQNPSVELDGKIEALFSQGSDTGESGVTAFGAFGPRAINTTDVGLPVVRGNWLVRAESTPEPSSALLAGLGFVILFSGRAIESLVNRKRRSRSGG